MGRTDHDDDLGDLRRGAAIAFFATMLVMLMFAGAGLMAGELAVMTIALTLAVVSLVAIVMTFRKPATARVMSRISLVAMIGLWVVMLALDGGPGDDLTGWLMLLGGLAILPIIALRTTGAIVRRELHGAPPWRMRPPRVLDVVAALGLAAALTQLAERPATAALLLVIAVAIPALPRFGWWLAGTAVMTGAGNLAASVGPEWRWNDMAVISFLLTLLMLPTMWLGMRTWSKRRGRSPVDREGSAATGDIGPDGASTLGREQAAVMPPSRDAAERRWFAPGPRAHGAGGPPPPSRE